MLYTSTFFVFCAIIIVHVIQFAIKLTGAALAPCLQIK